MNNYTNAAVEFLQMCARGDVAEAFAKHVAPDFRHHNAWFPDDQEALKQGMEQSARDEPNKSFDVKQTLESGDRVMVFSNVQRAQGDMNIAVVHILRFHNDQIVEMWDVGQVIPKDSPNQSGMF